MILMFYTIKVILFFYEKGKAYFNINDLDKSQKIFNEIIFINN